VTADKVVLLNVYTRQLHHKSARLQTVSKYIISSIQKVKSVTLRSILF